jgi:hypothetical protein
VFDGTNPPYATNVEANPLNVFGKTKRDGENVLWKNHADAVSYSSLDLPFTKIDLIYLRLILDGYYSYHHVGNSSSSTALWPCSKSR